MVDMSRCWDVVNLNFCPFGEFVVDVVIDINRCQARVCKRATEKNSITATDEDMFSSKFVCLFAGWMV